jgi:DNA-binding NarL/FixJ family response regulator
MSRIRILIAEDETMTRRLLERRLSHEADLEVVGQAENGRAAVDLAQQLKPDVVITDLSMPLANGIEVIEKVTCRLPGTRVILLTAHDDLASLGRASGAFECLSKQCTPEELVAAIRRAHKSERERGSEPAGGPTGHAATVEQLSARARLTGREKAVLHKAVETELTVHQIATALSADLQESVTHSAVKHALERVMGKLGVEPRTRAALVRYVLESGSATAAPDQRG